MSEAKRIMVRSSVSCDYILRIAREITEPDDFAEEFQLFANATENDTIRIEVTSIGGSMDTCHLLRRAIAQCPARTIGYVGPTCASAGTAIVLACDEWEVDEMSSFMIHTGSYGAWGKSPEVTARVEHQQRMIDRYVQDVYTGFLTEQEVKDTIRGLDFYFEGEELAERFMAYGEYRDQQRQEAIKELQEELAEVKAKVAALEAQQTESTEEQEEQE